MHRRFEAAFRSKTRAEWEAVFAELDACVTPVVGMDEVAGDAHATARAQFATAPDGISEPSWSLLLYTGRKKKKIDPSPAFFYSPGPETIADAGRAADTRAHRCGAAHAGCAAGAWPEPRADGGTRGRRGDYDWQTASGLALGVNSPDPSPLVVKLRRLHGCRRREKELIVLAKLANLSMVRAKTVGYGEVGKGGRGCLACLL